MNTKALYLLLLFVGFLFGCGHKSEKLQSAAERHQPSKVYTEAELNRLIVLGMSAAEVTNRFGSPTFIRPAGGEVTMFSYNFPFELKNERGPYLTGFTIYVRDQHVIKWAPITGMTMKSFDSAQSLSSFGEQEINLFVADGSLSNIAVRVGFQGEAGIHDLTNSPDLTVRAQIYVAGNGGNLQNKRQITLELKEPDISKLAQLSRNHIGEQLLVVCRSNIIAAPFIAAPLTSQRVTFSLENSNFFKGSQSE